MCPITAGRSECHGQDRAGIQDRRERLPVSRPDLSIWITNCPDLQPSDLILIAARPSMGKTAFVLNIAQYVAFHENMAT